MDARETRLSRTEKKGALSIRIRLILLLLVTLVPVLIIQGFTGFENYQTMKSEELQANLELARATGRTFDLFVQDVLHQQRIVGISLTRQPMTPDEMNQFLQQVPDWRGIVRDYEWVSSDSRILASRLPDLIGVDVSDRPPFREISAGKSWFVSDLLQGRYHGRPIFSISTGIRDEKGELLGLVFSSVLPERLDELFSFKRFQVGGISVVDGKGMLVYRYPHLELRYEDRKWAGFFHFVQEALEGREAVEVVPSSHLDGKSRFSAATPIRSIGWVVGASRVHEDVMQTINSTLIRQGNLFGAAAIASIFTAFLISKTISAPINTVKSQLRAMVPGRFKPLADVERPSEIQESCNAFNAVLVELQETTSVLQAISDMTPDPIYVKDTESRMLYANPATYGTIGKPRDEVMGRSEAEWHVDPQQAAAILANDRRVKAAKSTEVTEESFTSPEGTKIFLSTKSPYLDDKGRVIGVIGLSRDITERKRAEEERRKSEERLGLAIKVTQIGMFNWNVSTGQSLWTQQYEVLMGYPATASGSCSYKEWAHRVHPDDLARVEERVRHAMAERTPYKAEYRIVWPDGSLRWVEGQGLFTYDSEGRTERMLGTVRDITERKRAEEEKARLELQLPHAQKLEAIGTLAGGIAHDFNNILSPILGYARMVLDDVPETSSLNYDLKQVLTAADRAKDLVKQILTFSRRDKDQLMRPTDIGLVAKEALKLLRASLPSSIEIRQNINKGMAVADATQVHQVIVNLCTNAAHAMGDQGNLDVSLTEVTLSDEKLAALSIAELKPGSYLRLSVADTGRGMSAETIEHIFDPYFTTKGIGEGTGLGLAVVHGIVKGHGGEIRVQSTLGKGGVFDVYLPAVKANPQTQTPSIKGLPRGTERILLVDDEPDDRRIGQQDSGTAGLPGDGVDRPPRGARSLPCQPRRFRSPEHRLQHAPHDWDCSRPSNPQDPAGLAHHSLHRVQREAYAGKCPPGGNRSTCNKAF